MHKMLQTSNLKPGLTFILKSFGKTNSKYLRRLIAMGLIPGMKVKFVRVAPFGCPLYFSFASVNLALRKDEAQHLIWEKL